MSSKKLFDVLDKSTNKSKQRQKTLSESSDSNNSDYNNGDSNCGDSNSGDSNNSDSNNVDSNNSGSNNYFSSTSHHLLPVVTYKLRDEVTSAGGFTHLLSNGGSERIAFVFPTTNILSSNERLKYVREFISILYNVRVGQKKDKVNEILAKLIPPAPPTKCDKVHVQEFSQARNLAQNVENLPSDSIFKTPDPKLAPSTPGPRITKVPDINTPHTVEDSLRIINHLQLSEDDARYVRKISLVGLSSEYSVKKLRCELLGNEGKGFAKADKFSVKKWYRDKTQEIKNYVDGEPKRQDVIVGRIPSEYVQTAVQHWANALSERGEYVDLQQFDNCPEVLHDSVVLILGNDSGQGYCREGIRFCNRLNANSGSKVFVTTMVQGSDKGLSLYQKQELFSSLSALREVKTIKMGGKVRKLVKFSAMDYEAAHEDFGTQVGEIISHIRIFKSGWVWKFTFVKRK
jgi:hypothetical protein